MCADQGGEARGEGGGWMKRTGRAGTEHAKQLYLQSPQRGSSSPAPNTGAVQYIMVDSFTHTMGWLAAKNKRNTGMLGATWMNIRHNAEGRKCKSGIVQAQKSSHYKLPAFIGSSKIVVTNLW